MNSETPATPENAASTSTELTGGAGYTYEDTVVAYYLAALLREDGAAGQSGTVVKVSVQQRGQGAPLDDLVVAFRCPSGERRLDLQVKRSLTISAADSNADFREIIANSLATKAKPDFRHSTDTYGFVAESVAAGPLRNLRRFTVWAKSSTTSSEFTGRFEEGGPTSGPQRELRLELRPLIGDADDAEFDFYRHFVAPDLAGLEPGGALVAALASGLNAILATGTGQSGEGLFLALCSEARLGAGTGKVWTRPSLLQSLAPAFRLRGVPAYVDDLAIVERLAETAIADISDEVGSAHIDRASLIDKVLVRLTDHRFVNITGLPGSGKSAILRNVAQRMIENGPVLFLKSDLLQGTDWQSFAVARGLIHRDPVDMLAEIGSTGNAVLLIDGIDRIPPTQRNVIKDLLRAMVDNPGLGNWKVLVTSRDQGLEPFRNWVPVAIYGGSGIGDVPVTHFNDDEAEQLAKQLPGLRELLFGSEAVREIVRRPFFAAVLAGPGGAGADASNAKSEIDLIAYWWGGAGYQASGATLLQRQRALLDIASVGARSLGKAVSSLDLMPETIGQLAELIGDGIVRSPDEGATYSFTHDIFLEWAFYRLLIGRGSQWPVALVKAGQPPLLGRVVALLAQYSMSRGQMWEDGLAALGASGLRPQWRRAWLVGLPASPGFPLHVERFRVVLAKDDHALLRSFLVWFQAEQTIPSPLVLENEKLPLEGAARLRAADYLGWPSDFATWRRVLTWLLSIINDLPVPLLPHVLELFKVWQNMLSNIPNPISARILECCSTWLEEIESLKYRETLSFERGRWDALSSEGLSAFERGLRQLILLATPAYPAISEALLDRTSRNSRLRKDTYEQVIGFAPTVSLVAPLKLADLARAEVMELLPKQEIEQERRAEKRRNNRLARILAKPENERTEQEKRPLEHRIIGGEKEYGTDDLGIDKHHQSYFPTSPAHEPFASLFRINPDIARALVRDLANHATEAWRQVHAMRPRRFGTPIPLDLMFPWGAQRFWGDWNTYNWVKGYLAPMPLACAFLALAHWAHKQLDAGRPVDDVIREVLDGHQSLAVLCLAGALALEKQHVSATVLPIAASQRLWEYDIARASQETNSEIDLFGIGALTKLTGEKAAADAYLKGRASRFRDIRSLAPLFALSTDEALRSAFEAQLARFPEELPFHFEEHRHDDAKTAALKETAEQWAGLGSAQNYRAHRTDNEKQVLIEYQSPKLLSDRAQKRLESSSTSLGEYNVVGWANESLRAGALSSKYALGAVLDFVRKRDKRSTFQTLAEAGGGMTQSAISGAAACVIHFGGRSPDDTAWAWNVMKRVERMQEKRDRVGGGNMPWHPCFHLISVLAANLAKDAPRPDSAPRLLGLGVHPNEHVVQAAFSALLRGPNLSLAWITAALASDLFVHHHIRVLKDGTRDDSAAAAAAKAALSKARRSLRTGQRVALAPPPPPWPKSRPRSRDPFDDYESDDLYPKISFDTGRAEELVRAFPVETFCQSESYRALFLDYVRHLVEWTDRRFNPDGDRPDQRHRGRERADLHLWPSRLAELLARVSPYVAEAEMTARYLRPFLEPNDENGLSVTSEFAVSMVCRHVLDAASIAPEALSLLELTLDQLLQDNVFQRGRYRAGKVHGYDLPRLIKALLFVPIDEDAPGAARFANGDWSELPRVLPLVSRLIRTAGWSLNVMDPFLTLCERAALAYPADEFANLMTEVLNGLEEQAAAWVGTLLPARIAGLVQVQADGHFPLPDERAMGLLRVLDALIDLGDRRSAALQQSEAFRATHLQQEDKN